MLSDRSEYFVRIDDFPSGIRPKVDKYRSAAVRVFNEFEIRGIPYLLAVVPGHLEHEDHEFLAGLKHATISLHGVTHDYEFRDGRVRNEFSGKSVSEIVGLLESGLARMGKLPVNSVVPPHNEYDANFLVAARELGLKACYGGSPKVWRQRAALPVFHSYPPLYGTSRQVYAYLSEEGIPRSLKDRLRTLKHRSGKAIWDRLRQSEEASSYFRWVKQIVLHWTWENDVAETEKYRVGELAEFLSGQPVIDESTLIAGR